EREPDSFGAVRRAAQQPGRVDRGSGWSWAGDCDAAGQRLYKRANSDIDGDGGNQSGFPGLERSRRRNAESTFAVNESEQNDLRQFHEELPFQLNAAFARV